MKLPVGLLALVLSAGMANATTIIAGGGTVGATFVTSTGVTLTTATADFRVGTWDGTTFTQFAVTDASPIDISTVGGALAGKWANNTSDNSAAANAFTSSQAVWFEVSVDLGNGSTGRAYFSGTPTFPNNGSGVGDSLAYNSTSLTILGAGSTAGSAAYNAGTGNIVIGVTSVPEPSAALLGALGALGLLRRRR